MLIEGIIVTRLRMFIILLFYVVPLVCLTVSGDNLLYQLYILNIVAQLQYAATFRRCADIGGTAICCIVHLVKVGLVPTVNILDVRAHQDTLLFLILND